MLGFISGHSGKKTHHSSTTCNQFLNKRTFQKLITLKVKTVRKKRKQVEFDECELLCYMKWYNWRLICRKKISWRQNHWQSAIKTIFFSPPLPFPGFTGRRLIKAVLPLITLRSRRLGFWLQNEALNSIIDFLTQLSMILRRASGHLSILFDSLRKGKKLLKRRAPSKLY